MKYKRNLEKSILTFWKKVKYKFVNLNFQINVIIRIIFIELTIALNKVYIKNINFFCFQLSIAIKTINI